MLSEAHDRVLVAGTERLLGDDERAQLKDLLDQAGRIRRIVARMQSIRQYATTAYPGSKPIVDLEAASRQDPSSDPTGE